MGSKRGWGSSSRVVHGARRGAEGPATLRPVCFLGVPGGGAGGSQKGVGGVGPRGPSTSRSRRRRPSCLWSLRAGPAGEGLGLGRVQGGCFRRVLHLGAGRFGFCVGVGPTGPGRVGRASEGAARAVGRGLPAGAGGGCRGPRKGRGLPRARAAGEGVEGPSRAVGGPAGRECPTASSSMCASSAGSTIASTPARPASAS